MYEVSQVVPVAPERVFAVLGDGWSYGLWVVGAAHMRDVGASWPAKGSRLHHSVGAWPVLIEDETEVVDVQPDRRLELLAAAWPAGRARVVIQLHPTEGGTRVTIGERAEDGPARLLPGPLQAVLLKARNTESLRRLAAIAAHRG
jgi:uncharacterized protein YndB with AHSA1/START domain